MDRAFGRKLYAVFGREPYWERRRTGDPTPPAADDVIAADWFPDGSKLAIVRYLDGEFRIEAPPGEVVVSGKERWSHVRVAPDGRSLAGLRFAAAMGSDAAVVRIARIDPLDALGGQR